MQYWLKPHNLAENTTKRKENPISLRPCSPKCMFKGQIRGSRGRRFGCNLAVCLECNTCENAHGRAPILESFDPKSAHWGYRTTSFRVRPSNWWDPREKMLVVQHRRQNRHVKSKGSFSLKFYGASKD